MNIRPIAPRDNNYVVDIEIKSYSKPWPGDEFTRFARRSVVGVVDGKPVGYYVLQGYRLLRFAIHPQWRRMGCGTQLMEQAKAESGHKLTIVVPETNETAQLFLRSCGFQCVNVIPKCFQDLGVYEAGYYFLWKKAWEDR